MVGGLLEPSVPQFPGMTPQRRGGLAPRFVGACELFVVVVVLSGGASGKL